MCRWLAYSGASLQIEQLLFNTTHSLIEQSRHAREAETKTNADGFGLGWYAGRDKPGIFHSMLPAWNDHNLRELAHQVESPLFLAHVRAATGTPVQETNCHPFRYANWLFAHNGIVRDFRKVRRRLTMAVDPEYYLNIEGTTDSEILFHLALTFGLMEDPFPAIERMVGFVEEVGRASGIENPIQMTLGLSDGVRIYGVRYSSEHESNSLFHTKPMSALRGVYEPADRYSDDARALVSEPLTNDLTPWVEVPESAAILIEEGRLEEFAFAPRAP